MAVSTLSSGAFAEHAATKVKRAYEMEQKYALNGRELRDMVPFHQAISWMPRTLACLNEDIAVMRKQLEGCNVTPQDHRPFHRLYENYQGLVRLCAAAQTLWTTYGPFIESSSGFEEEKEKIRTLKERCEGFPEKLLETRKSLISIGDLVYKQFNRIAFLSLHIDKLKFISDENFDSHFLATYIKGLQVALLQATSLNDLIQRVEECRKILPGDHADIEPTAQRTDLHQSGASNSSEEISFEEAIKMLLHLKDNCLYQLMFLQMGYDSPFSLTYVELVSEQQSKLDELQACVEGRGELPEQLIREIRGYLVQLKQIICEEDPEASSARPSWKESILFNFDFQSSGLRLVLRPIFHTLSEDELGYQGNFPSIEELLNEFLGKMRGRLMDDPKVKSAKPKEKPMAAATIATPAVTFSDLENRFSMNAPTYQERTKVNLPLKDALPLGEKRLEDITGEVQVKIDSVIVQGRNIRNSSENVEDARKFIEQAAVLQTLYEQAMECKAFFDEHLPNLSPQSNDESRAKVLADLQAAGITIPENALGERDSKHTRCKADQEMLTEWTRKFEKSLSTLTGKMTELKDLIVPITGEDESVIWDLSIDARDIFGARSVLEGCLDTATTKEQLAAACMTAAQALSNVAQSIDPGRYNPVEFSLLVTDDNESGASEGGVANLDVADGSDNEQQSQDE